MTDLALIAGVSALVAAVATVVGAVFLGLFFAKGEPWGTLNDLASIVLMIGTMPVALFVADVTGPTISQAAWAVAIVGLLGMATAAVAQGLLVLRTRTYEALLPWTLGAGAVVGAWYLLVGVTGFVSGFPPVLAALALASGVGFIAIGYGFWRGDQRHPASIVGGLVLLVASTAFLGWIGIAALAAHGLSR